MVAVLRGSSVIYHCVNDCILYFANGNGLLLVPCRDIDGRRELIVTPRYDVPKNLPQMDSATVSKLDRNAKAKAGVPNIQITNPLNGASIQWAPSINAGMEFTTNNVE